METYKKTFILTVLFFAVVAVTTASATVTPTLSVSSTGSGDNVQISVSGDPNSSVIFFYIKTGVGLSGNYIGTTNSSGTLSTTVSSSSYVIASGTAVYVTLGGANGAQSNQAYWPVVSSTTSNNVSLSQSGVVLPVGQSTTVTASNYGSSSLYLLNNSNPSIANINISGGQVSIMANATGSTVATICVLNSTTNCSSIYITAQSASASQLNFSQNNISIAPGQSVPITISNGTGSYYVTNNSNPSTIQANVSGTTVTITTASTSGSASITICSINLSSCGLLKATATTTGTSTITFSQTSPSVTVGQSTLVTVYGATGSVFYVSSNSNPSIVQANLSGSTLTLTGIANGSSTVAVCSSSGSCGNLAVTVNYASSGGTMALSQNSISILSGQTLSVTISGGYTPYDISSSISGSIFQASLNGNIINVSGVASGSSSFDICSSGGGGCVTLYVIVNGTVSPTTNQPTFSQNNISLNIGQGTTVYISGNGNYYVGNNSNPSLVSVSINSSTAIVSALASGSSNITICQNGGGCAVLIVNVASSASTTQTATPVTTTQPAYVFLRYLGYGDKGDDVLQLQNFLLKQGFLTATPNGRFGPSTKLAVQKFQKAHSIRQTGNMGPSTKDALNQILGSSSSANLTREQQILQIQQAIELLKTQLLSAQ